MPQRHDELRRIFRRFGRALTEAIAESPDATRSLRRLREEGCDLYLLLGATGEIRARALLAASPDHGPRDAAEPPKALPPAPFEANGGAGAGIEWGLDTAADPDRPPATNGRAGRPSGDGARARRPGFRIDASDLAFLRSIGIDPTRRAPRRRKG